MVIMEIRIFVKQQNYIIDGWTKKFVPVKRKWKRHGSILTVNKDLEPERIIEYATGIPYSELYIISKTKYKKTTLVGSLGGETFKIEKMA